MKVVTSTECGGSVRPCLHGRPLKQNPLALAMGSTSIVTKDYDISLSLEKRTSNSWVKGFLMVYAGYGTEEFFIGSELKKIVFHSDYGTTRNVLPEQLYALSQNPTNTFGRITR